MRAHVYTRTYVYAVRARRHRERMRKALTIKAPVTPQPSTALVLVWSTGRVFRLHSLTMREIVHLQAGQCGNQIGSKVSFTQVFAL